MSEHSKYEIKIIVIKYALLSGDLLEYRSRSFLNNIYLSIDEFLRKSYETWKGGGGVAMEFILKKHLMQPFIRAPVGQMLAQNLKSRSMLASHDETRLTIALSHCIPTK